MRQSSGNSSNIADYRTYYGTSNAGSGSMFAFWAIPLILSAFGVVVISSMTGWSYPSPGMKQALWFVISVCACGVVMLIPLSFWQRYSALFLGVSFLLILLTLFSPLRVTVKGASRWIRLGPINFQPLEIVSFTIMIHLSKVYFRIEKKWQAVVVTALIAAPFLAVLLKQPDYGGFLMLSCIIGALFVERYGIFVPFCFAVAVSPFLWVVANMGYRADRVATWLNPWSDPLGAGYQVIQGLIAFANGHLTGVGLGRSQQFLPEVHNDFIFPAIGEQLGLFGTMSVFFLFLFWTVCVFAAYNRAAPKRRILIWGVCVAVLMPFFINLGGVMKIIPLTGMPLPFISYGGTSLVFMWARIGLLIRLVCEPDDEE